VALGVGVGVRDVGMPALGLGLGVWDGVAPKDREAGMVCVGVRVGVGEAAEGGGGF